MQAIVESQPEYADVKESELTYFGQLEYKARRAAKIEDLLDVCEMLNLEVSPERKTKLAQMGLGELQRVWDYIKQHRAWPSE